MTKLYTRTWKNTGMEGTPIYVFQTPNPNGTLGDAVGDIIILSEDTSRKYIIRDGEKLEIPGGFEVDISNVKDIFFWKEYGVDKCGMLRILVKNIEEIYIKGYSDVLWGYDIFEEMGFILEGYFDSDTHESMCRAYNKEFAKKLHLGENVSYCFNAESLVKLMAEYPNAKCNFKLEEVIMEYPDGSYDEDMAYVVYHE